MRLLLLSTKTIASIRGTLRLFTESGPLPFTHAIFMKRVFSYAQPLSLPVPHFVIANLYPLVRSIRTIYCVSGSRINRGSWRPGPYNVDRRHGQCIPNHAGSYVRCLQHNLA